MIGLAIRLILHEPLRFFAGLLGISVSAGLAFIQLGLYNGFKENASIIVDHTDGDIWVCARHQDNFDFPALLSPQTLDLVHSTRGVKSARPLLIVFSDWLLENGAETTVQIVGFDAEHGVGGPWQLLRGFSGDLAQPGTVTLDSSAQEQLDNADLNTTAEIGQIEARVVGVTDGIRSFQGNPMLFTSLDSARSIGHLADDAVHYIVVEVEPGADRKEVLEYLRHLDYTEAYTREEFSKKAQDYWLNSTGAGPALGFTALLGLLVGIVVAGQVQYTSTLEHIKEYGTLKAVGASNFQVACAIMAQSVASAIPAHLIAGILLLIAGHFIGGTGIYLSFGFKQYCWSLLLTLGICILAALFPMWKVMRLEPAVVFSR